MSVAIQTIRSGLLLMFVLLSVAAVGCSSSDSNIGRVTGVVTLDGEPVENATVTFVPEGGGSPSNARTNSDGTYELRYTRSVAGAEVGAHHVKITTYQPANPDSEPPVAGTPERIPPNYNAQTELTVQVQPGSNEHDFQLHSKQARKAETTRR